MTGRDERGSAVVDFTLISLLLIPLVLGVLQVGLCLHVRNTLAAAASEGARLAARDGQTPRTGAAETRRIVDETLAGRYAVVIRGERAIVGGAPGVRVRARAEVPALGLFGPAITIEVAGHGVAEAIR